MLTSEVFLAFLECTNKAVRVIEFTFPSHPPQPQSQRPASLPRHRKVHLFWKAARLYISLFKSLANTVLCFNNPFTLELHFCSYVINRFTFSQDGQNCFFSSLAQNLKSFIEKSIAQHGQQEKTFLTAWQWMRHAILQKITSSVLQLLWESVYIDANWYESHL